MMYDDKLQIQFLLINEGFSSLRKIKYRICNKQLPWWQRNFIFNPWRKLFFTDVSGNTHDNFNKWEWQNQLKPLKTIGEIREYINKQVQQIRKSEDDWT